LGQKRPCNWHSGLRKPGKFAAAAITATLICGAAPRQHVRFSAELRDALIELADGGKGLNWWTHLLRDELLSHAAPDTLSIEELVSLQASLLAKMVLVNGELHARYADILASTDETQSDTEARDVLTKAAAHIEGINHLLRDELARVMNEKHVNALDDED
jgi:hypothetical protein